MKEMSEDSGLIITNSKPFIGGLVDIIERNYKQALRPMEPSKGPRAMELRMTL